MKEGDERESLIVDPLVCVEIKKEEKFTYVNFMLIEQER